MRCAEFAATDPAAVAIAATGSQAPVVEVAVPLGGTRIAAPSSTAPGGGVHVSGHADQGALPRRAEVAPPRSTRSQPAAVSRAAEIERAAIEAATDRQAISRRANSSVSV